MRGFMGGTKTEPELVQIRVECDRCRRSQPARRSASTTRYVAGEFNYYDPDATRADGDDRGPLDTLATDLAFPVGQPVEGLVQPADVEITAINDVAAEPDRA